MHKINGAKQLASIIDKIGGIGLMSGMVTTGDTNLSSYGSRTVEIEVTGMCRQDIMRTGNYTVKIPHSRMSQTMQSISRMGGKVANVTLLPAHDRSSEAPEATENSEESQGKRNRGKRGRKK